MGFGFNLFFTFILIPSFVILIITWVLTRKIIFGKIIGCVVLGVLGLTFLSLSIQFLTSKTKLEKQDYYGQYVINRDYFKGKQADWQYENFRFEIKDNDSLYFYVTNKNKILKTYRGTISTSKPYNSEILIINMQQPTHHIVTHNPTVYRDAWGFYLVFYSPKFNNVYFKKRSVDTYRKLTAEKKADRKQNLKTVGGSIRFAKVVGGSFKPLVSITNLFSFFLLNLYFVFL